MPKKNQKLLQTVSSSPDKNVPKFCSTMGFTVLENQHVILTLSYNEDPAQPHTVIERVIIDKTHAKKIHEVLGNILEKMDKK